ncbi:MAG: tetratricopeptide repeat protein [Parvularculaceae bacterium]
MTSKRISLRRARTLLLGAAGIAAAACLAPAAIAAPSGGGGGGEMPSGSSAPSFDPAQSYEEGVAALQAKDYKLAEKKLGEVLSVAPKHPEANYYMGLAKVGRGKDKGAVRYFVRAIKERSNFTEAREQLALVSIKLGKPETANEQLAALKEQQAKCQAEDCGTGYTERVNRAVERIDAALAAPPADAAPSEGEGSGDEPEEGDDTSALPSTEHVAGLFLAPREEGVAEYHAAVKLINEASYETAIAGLYEAQASVGPHPDILNYLGFAHRKLGQFDKARGYYAQALAIDPAHLGATEYLGELYLEIGDVARAKRQLARLDELCAFGCAEREDLARLISIKETTRNAARAD